MEITSAIVKYLEQLHQQTATGSTLGRQLEELESGLPGHQSYGSKDGGRVRLVDAGRPMRGLTRYEIQLLSAYYLGSDGYRTGAAGAGGGEVSDRSSSYATFTAIGRARGMSARDVEFDWKVARNKVRKNLERL